MRGTPEQETRFDYAGAPIEHIVSGARCLAMIVRSEFIPEGTTFLTSQEFTQQVGLIVYPKDSEVQRHVHVPAERKVVGTSEAVFVRRGRCKVDLYDEDRQLAATRELGQGDVVLLIAGGHGFRMLEDTVLLEVKQGPYLGVDDKERF